MPTYCIGSPNSCTGQGFKIRRLALTKIITVIFETLTRVVETLRCAVIGVGCDRLCQKVMLASRVNRGEGSGRVGENVLPTGCSEVGRPGNMKLPSSVGRGDVKEQERNEEKTM